MVLHGQYYHPSQKPKLLCKYSSTALICMHKSVYKLIHMHCISKEDKLKLLQHTTGATSPSFIES